MGIEQRRHPRFAVHLAVRYATAAAFVADYIENLSVGGLFIAGAQHLRLHDLVDVALELPERGEWRVVGKAVFLLDPESARRAGRKPGAGLEIVDKPPGFDDAVVGYLFRLGRRREHAVIAAEIPGVHAITDAGYRMLPLASPFDVSRLLSDEAAGVLGVLVPPSFVDLYRTCAQGRLFSATTPDDVHDALARIDSLL
jgi:Tfp pilus assembly protein PilZ